MPEDAHTTLKAFAYSHGADVLVPTYALISNDLVTGMSDRYVQAKRHAWGVTEVGYVAACYQHLRFSTWVKLLGARIKGELTIVPPILAFAVPGFWQFLFSIQPKTLYFLIAIFCYQSALQWIVQIAVEIVTWNVLLPPLAPHIPPPTPRQKLYLVLLNTPGVSFLLTVISVLLFHVAPRWHATYLAFVQTELKYVTAPKGDLKTRIAAAAASVKSSIKALSTKLTRSKKFSYSSRESANEPREVATVGADSGRLIEGRAPPSHAP